MGRAPARRAGPARGRDGRAGAGERGRHDADRRRARGARRKRAGARQRRRRRRPGLAVPTRHRLRRGRLHAAAPRHVPRGRWLPRRLQPGLLRGRRPMPDAPRAGLRTMYVPDVRVLHGGFSSGGESAATTLFERNRPVFVARWGDRLAATHPPSLWPPDPATTLAARDALATGRALVVCDAIPSPAGELGAAVRDVQEGLPWARITIAGRQGDPEPWWRMGVEVLLRDDPAQVVAERAGHYDLVAEGAEFDGRTALEVLRRAPADGAGRGGRRSPSAGSEATKGAVRPNSREGARCVRRSRGGVPLASWSRGSLAGNLGGSLAAGIGEALATPPRPDYLRPTTRGRRRPSLSPAARNRRWAPSRAPRAPWTGRRSADRPRPGA